MQASFRQLAGPPFFLQTVSVPGRLLRAIAPPSNAYYRTAPLPGSLRPSRSVPRLIVLKPSRFSGSGVVSSRMTATSKSGPPHGPNIFRADQAETRILGRRSGWFTSLYPANRLYADGATVPPFAGCMFFWRREPIRCCSRAGLSPRCSYPSRCVGTRRRKNQKASSGMSKRKSGLRYL